MLIDNFLMNLIFAAISPVNRLDESSTPYVYGVYRAFAVRTCWVAANCNKLKLINL